MVMTLAAISDRILAALTTAGHGLTVAELAETVDVIKADVYHAASSLVAAGKITRRHELRTEQHGTVYSVRDVVVWALPEEAEQRLHSIPAVAARIGVSPEYLREQCREGKQECYHIAGQYFLDDAQIVRFLKERRKDRKVKAKKGSESDATL